MRSILIIASVYTLSCAQKGSAQLANDTPVNDDTAASGDCADALISFDFESDEQGFTSWETDEGFEDPWQWGNPQTQTCHSGDHCWTTGLGGWYDDCVAGALVSQTLDLTACADSDLTLSFWHFYRFEDQSSYTWWDGGKVQVSADAGETWQDVNPSEPYTGAIMGNFSECEIYSEFYGEEGWSGIGYGWNEVTATIDASVLTDSFQVRFWFVSDRSVTDEGWFIDDVAIVQ